MPESRWEILERFRTKRAQGKPIIGGGAGTGLSAKCEEAGGIDLIVIYNSGRFRMAGRGSLAGLMPYGNANTIVREMANEILPVVKRTPVLAGVCATDPFLILDPFLRELRDLGFAGIQISRPSGSSMEPFGRIWRKPAWAFSWRSTASPLPTSSTC
jgi:predicted TIM-barrel enzyme